MSQQTGAPAAPWAPQGASGPGGPQAAPGQPQGVARAQGGPLVPGGVPATARARRGPAGALRSVFEGSPGRLRLVATVTALAAAVFGLLGGNSLWSASGALDRADHNTSQVVRIQSIYSDLVRADSDATNAFLIGGLEPPEQRADYDAAIARVATSIAEAAQAQPADGEALGALNQQVQQYSALVEQARAYNRQGLPLGASYLNNASTGLRSGALPIIQALTDANTTRQQEEFRGSSQGIALAVAGAVALVVLLLAMVWLARRSHRYLNLPLSVGVFLVLVALILGATTITSVRNTVSSARAGTVAVTLDLATLQSAAYDAKSNESLTLISRGSGSAFEKAWKTRSSEITAAIGDISARTGNSDLAQQLDTQWKAYSGLHEKIRSTDDGGGWDAAVALAGDRSAGTANAAFTTFSRTTEAGLAAYGKAASDAVTTPRTRVTIMGWVLLVICLGAAALAARGFGQRLEEYR